MSRGELKANEPHPSAFRAKEYLFSLGVEKLFVYQSSYSSCAIEGNRLAEICSETLSRLLSGKPVSDRYLLGLAWSIREMEDNHGN
jgi:hypothetical protein